MILGLETSSIFEVLIPTLLIALGCGFLQQHVFSYELTLTTSTSLNAVQLETASSFCIMVLRCI